MPASEPPRCKETVDPPIFQRFGGSAVEVLLCKEPAELRTP